MQHPNNDMNHNNNNKTVSYLYTDIVIVGAGVAGTSTLYHLLPYCHQTIHDIIIIDAGSKPGVGFDHINIIDNDKLQSTNTKNISNNNQKQQQQSISTSSSIKKCGPRYSGTAVFMDNNNYSNGNDKKEHTTPATELNHSDVSTYHNNTNKSSSSSKIIKMMVQLFACNCTTFIHHHGIDGAKTYLTCTKYGLQIQKRLAYILIQKYLSNHNTTTATLLYELGSLYLAKKDDVIALKDEYNLLKSLCSNNSGNDNNIDNEDDVFEDNGIEWYECDGNNCSGRLYSTNTVQSNTNNTNGTSLSSYMDTNMNQFYAGIYFKNDAIIDSSLYSQLLLQYSIALSLKQQQQHQHVHHPPKINTKMNTIVTSIQRFKKLYTYNEIQAIYNNNVTYINNNQDNGNNNRLYGAIIECYNIATKVYTRILCRHVIVATGGLSIPSKGCCIQDLYGILKPCYSYLVHVPMSVHVPIQNNPYQGSKNNNNPNRSCNYFTWNFTHDWCYTDTNHIRISGEDHYSARKDTHLQERCHNLIDWTYEQYSDTNGIKNCNIDYDHIPKQSGVYTETPDCAPIVGCIESDTDRIVCYIVGCNAWGQTIMSYTATIIPAILGYRPYTTLEENVMKVLSIQRFIHSSTTMEESIPEHCETLKLNRNSKL